LFQALVHVRCCFRQLAQSSFILVQIHHRTGPKMRYSTDFLDEATNMDFAVKNTFMNFIETEKTQKIRPRRHSDFGQNRDKASLEYIQSFFSDIGQKQTTGESAPNQGRHSDPGPNAMRITDNNGQCTLTHLSPASSGDNETQRKPTWMSEDSTEPTSEDLPLVMLDDPECCEQWVSGHLAMPPILHGAFGLKDVDLEGSFATGGEMAPAVSMGSVGHVSGTCKPCAWFWKPGSCSKGYMCEYCHSCKQGVFEVKTQQRKSKKRSRPKASSVATGYAYSTQIGSPMFHDFTPTMAWKVCNWKLLGLA